MDAGVQKRTAGAAVLLAGLWVALSPLVINMSDIAMWNAIIAGGLLALMGVGQMVLRSGTLGVVGVLLALWLGFSVFFIDQSTASAWSLIVAGVVGLLASLWDVMAAQDIGAPKISHPF